MNAIDNHRYLNNSTPSYALSHRLPPECSIPQQVPYPCLAPGLLSRKEGRTIKIIHEMPDRNISQLFKSLSVSRRKRKIKKIKIKMEMEEGEKFI